MKFYKNQDKQVRFLTHIIQTYKSKEVLDIGFGSGYHANAISKLPASVTGLDPNSIENAQFKQINTSIFDFKPKQSFDFIYCLSPYLGDRWSDYDTLFKRVSSILNPSGIFLLDYFDFHRYDVGSSFQSFRDSDKAIALSKFSRHRDHMLCERTIVNRKWERKNIELRWKVFDPEEESANADRNSMKIIARFEDFDTNHISTLGEINKLKRLSSLFQKK